MNKNIRFSKIEQVSSVQEFLKLLEDYDEEIVVMLLVKGYISAINQLEKHKKIAKKQTTSKVFKM